MIKKLLIDRTDSVPVQMGRYSAAGFVAFLVDYCTFILLTEIAGVHYLVAGIIAFSLAVVVNYTASRLWVFNRFKRKSRLSEVTIFALIAVFGAVLHQLLLWSLTDFLAVHYLISKLASNFIVFVVNFVLKKVILF